MVAGRIIAPEASKLGMVAAFADTTLAEDLGVVDADVGLHKLGEQDRGDRRQIAWSLERRCYGLVAGLPEDVRPLPRPCQW